MLIYGMLNMICKLLIIVHILDIAPDKKMLIMTFPIIKY